MMHRRPNRAEWTLASLFALLTLVPAGCTVDFTEEGLGSEIAFEAERPEVRETPQEVSRYSGEEPNVMEAQERFPNGLELQRKVVWRTCTPNPRPSSTAIFPPATCCSSTRPPPTR